MSCFLSKPVRDPKDELIALYLHHCSKLVTIQKGNVYNVLLLMMCSGFLLFFFSRILSLWNAGWPGTHCID